MKKPDLRVHVRCTENEQAIIRKAATHLGFRASSEFVRVAVWKELANLKSELLAAYPELANFYEQNS